MRITKDQIRNARAALGLSQADFGSKLGVSGSTISLLERGETSPISVSEDDPSYAAWQALLKNDLQALEQLPTPFAAWLKRSRLQRKLSVSEFGDQCNISPSDLDAMERGARVPASRSLRSIEDFLGEQAPNASLEEHLEAPIIGVGALQDFDPHNSDKRPLCGGIYVLYDISDRPIYVGESKNIRQRLKQHEEKFWFRRPLVEYAAYIQVEDDALRKGIEQILINFLRSNAVLNKQHVARG